jgi:hypothetical protein
MTLPAVLLGFVIPTLYGALFHLWRGGGIRRLGLLIFLSWLGFWVGQIAGAAFDITIFQVGNLLLGTATAGSLVFLIGGNWLFRGQE